MRWYKIPILVENKEKKFTLFLNKNRCGGNECYNCIAVCPTGILEPGDELNMRVAYLPRVKQGKEKYCTACRRCEYSCPEWCIYVIEQEEEKSAEKAET